MTTGKLASPRQAWGLRKATPARSSASLPCAALFMGLALATTACGKSGAGGDPLAHAEPNDGFADVPVPAADGPKFVVIRDALGVHERPSPNAKKLGELAVGAVVARSKEPYGTRDCDGGWYAVRPRGFVCADGASLDLALAGKLPAPPDLARPLPYRYGRARSENVPLYARMPTAAEQADTEPDLAKLLRKGIENDPLGAAANDVPLDARGVPTGPAVLLPGGDGIVDGKRTVASWFAFARDAAPPAVPASAELKGRALRKGSGVALTGTFTADGGAGPRRFGVTVDGHVVPTDRLKPTLGSVWHGIDLDKIGLPVAFVHKLETHTWTLQKGKAIKHDDELERRAAIPLTGRFRTVDGIRFEEAKTGEWLRAQDLTVVVRRHKFPDFAKGTQKWLDVSIANQTLTAYEGTKPVYATLISSGRDMLKEGEAAAATPRGTFRVLGKYVTRAVDSRETANAFDAADAPWVLAFDPGAAITGMYWSDGVGEAQGFHNVALTPIDAHRIWSWADPPLPEGWHAVFDGGGESTIVNVRP